MARCQPGTRPHMRTPGTSADLPEHRVALGLASLSMAGDRPAPPRGET